MKLAEDETKVSTEGANLSGAGNGRNCKPIALRRIPVKRVPKGQSAVIRANLSGKRTEFYFTDK